LEETDKKLARQKCCVVKDLLPLYQDDALSKESREFVEEHLAVCPECRTVVEQMRRESGSLSAAPATDDEAAIINSSDEEDALRMKKIASRMRNRRRKIIYGIAVTLVLLYFLMTRIFATGFVIGNSMEPSYPAGKNVIVNKLAYLISSPKRGDVVFYRYNNSIYMKRIVGLPGDTVDISGQELIINGEPANIKQVSGVIKDRGDVTYPVVLGEDEYFVLGDNLDNSTDSRFLICGNISREEITGKVICKFIPDIFLQVSSASTRD
jgi:signal peptidase I